ncbi:MAG: hypothetical protein QOI15_2685 [Pseudonocardiales bacterium]|nr:hypothetical protein [Pseudonocardiales bacterium]MDT4921783.1 hypothetical protein [Pseudonocardiales bacterium]MDT4942738.1 hypothetical protein [Pseudonocardiales bacterium]
MLGVLECEADRVADELSDGDDEAADVVGVAVVTEDDGTKDGSEAVPDESSGNELPPGTPSGTLDSGNEAPPNGGPTPSVFPPPP